jgi:hypothetical protein
MERLQLSLFDLPPEPPEPVDDRQFSKPSRQSSRPKQQLKPLRFGLPEYGPHLEANQRMLWAEELRIQHYQ